jgi:hypothetical protein
MLQTGCFSRFAQSSAVSLACFPRFEELERIRWNQRFDRVNLDGILTIVPIFSAYDEPYQCRFAQVIADTTFTSIEIGKLSPIDHATEDHRNRDRVFGQCRIGLRTGYVASVGAEWTIVYASGSESASSEVAVAYVSGSECCG